MDEFKQLEAELAKTCANLREKYNLKTVVRQNVLFGPNELRLMMEYNMSSDDVFGAQNNLLYLVYMYILARPGSLLPTQSYNGFLSWSEVKLRRRFDGEGQCQGFDTEIILTRLKGYQQVRSRCSTFSVRGSYIASAHPHYQWSLTCTSCALVTPSAAIH